MGKGKTPLETRNDLARMKLPEKIVAVAFAVAVALQAWTLKEVVQLKVAVAKIETRLEGANRRGQTETQNKTEDHERNF